MKALEELGFEVIRTGGGCSAWSKEYNGFEILISDEASSDLSGENCCVHLLDQNGEIFMYVDTAVDNLSKLITSTLKSITKYCEE